MGFKLIISLISIFFILILSFFYFVPMKSLNFESFNRDSNFSSLPLVDNDMQFYSNMRFPEHRISYKIIDCSIKKQNEMQSAFDILQNSTNLEFYPVTTNQEISIYCEEKDRIEEGLFIGGEGGPTNMTSIGDFAVILNGKILLIRESSCPRPNIAIHELLHVLGIKHSENSKNIMYPITNCDQIIGDDTLSLLNQLYTIPSNPDLIFENVSAKLSGRFLDVDFLVMNAGLSQAQDFTIDISTNGESIKKIDVESIGIGFGRFVSLKNIWVSQLKIQELELTIESKFNEISKENNKIRLEIKDD